MICDLRLGLSAFPGVSFIVVLGCGSCLLGYCVNREIGDGGRLSGETPQS